MDLKLAICHPFLYTFGGAEKVVLKIAKHFDAKIYCSLYTPESTFAEFRNLDIEVLKPKYLGALPTLLPKRVRDAAIAGEEFNNLEIKGFD
ncbi:MAG: hypothetical protein ABIH99_03790, partial [Candidatus Micrarchaeota archaeon]